MGPRGLKIEQAKPRASIKEEEDESEDGKEQGGRTGEMKNYDCKHYPCSRSRVFVFLTFRQEAM